jgi:hypothetical protein
LALLAGGRVDEARPFCPNAVFVGEIDATKRGERLT